MPVTVGPWDSVEYDTARGLIASAGPIGTAFNIVAFIYNFGKTNPIELALQRLGQEIDALRAEIDQLRNRVGELAVARSPQLEPHDGHCPQGRCDPAADNRL